MHERLVSVGLLERERHINTIVWFQNVFRKSAAVSKAQPGFEACIVSQRWHRYIWNATKKRLVDMLRAALLLPWEDGSPHQGTGSSRGNKITSYMRNEIRCGVLFYICHFSFLVSFSDISGLCHQTHGRDSTILSSGGRVSCQPNRCSGDQAALAFVSNSNTIPLCAGIVICSIHTLMSCSDVTLPIIPRLVMAH